MKIKYKEPYWVKFEWEIDEHHDNQYVTSFDKTENKIFNQLFHKNEFLITINFKIKTTITQVIANEIWRWQDIYKKQGAGVTGLKKTGAGAINVGVSILLLTGVGEIPAAATYIGAASTVTRTSVSVLSGAVGEAVDDFFPGQLITGSNDPWQYMGIRNFTHESLPSTVNTSSTISNGISGYHRPCPSNY